MAEPVFAVFGWGGGELLLFLFALLVMGLVVAGLAVAAYFVIRSLTAKPVSPVPEKGTHAEPATSPAKATAQDANLAGSQFHHVNLAGADFDNVNLTSARFYNVNLSNVTISAAQIGGATFKHIGPPPGEDGKQERQRPVRFEEMMLCDSTFQKVDLSNVRVTNCDLTGMTIDGVLVSELLAAYGRQQAE